MFHTAIESYCNTSRTCSALVVNNDNTSATISTLMTQRQQRDKAHDAMTFRKHSGQVREHSGQVREHSGQVREIQDKSGNIQDKSGNIQDKSGNIQGTFRGRHQRAALSQHYKRVLLTLSPISRNLTLTRKRILLVQCREIRRHLLSYIILYSNHVV
jgi:hypothetical protein